MVLERVAALCADQYGCAQEDVVLGASFDELNIRRDELGDLALMLEELIGVPLPDEALDGFVTVEDLVGYIEDRL